MAFVSYKICLSASLAVVCSLLWSQQVYGQASSGAPTRTPITQGLDGEVYDSMVASSEVTYARGFFSNYGP